MSLLVRRCTRSQRVAPTVGSPGGDAGRYAYGSDRFGRFAERFVRVFGMPWFLAGQTAVIAAWVVVNAVGSGPRFDPYPFIFLNLLFSALAAYAAPFILLAQTREADRDKARADEDARHREELAIHQARLLEEDAAQTEQIARLLEENRRQTEHITELLQQTRRLLEREGEQTDLIASLASQTIETAQASHVLTREIHAHTVTRGDQHEGGGAGGTAPVGATGSTASHGERAGDASERQEWAA
jgi:uncharacterized membrane protein